MYGNFSKVLYGSGLGLEARNVIRGVERASVLFRFSCRFGVYSVTRSLGVWYVCFMRALQQFTPTYATETSFCVLARVIASPGKNKSDVTNFCALYCTEFPSMFGLQIHLLPIQNC